MRKFSFTSVVSFQGRSGANSIRQVAGQIMNGDLLTASYPQEKWADFIHAKDIALGVRPANPVMKVTLSQWVDEFFQCGSLKLGSLSHYRRFEDPELGDRTEGCFILVGCAASKTHIANVSAGDNYWVFCCKVGVPNAEQKANLKGDSCYQIHDVDGFARAVQARIGATRYTYALCRYCKDKVIVSELPDDFDFDPNVYNYEPLVRLVNEAKYFGVLQVPRTVRPLIFLS